MTNPADKIIQLNKPFVYFHTHVINPKILDVALAAKKSLEVDMSVAEDGQSIFVGHPLNFYEFKGQPPPDNLPLDSILEKMKPAGLYLVLDCKDVRAVPRAQDIINDFGAANCLFHSWIEELEFKPYPPEIIVEPHWVFEDLPLQDVRQLHQATNVPVIMSARGLTQECLKKDGHTIVGKIIDVSKGNALAINFNLPGGEAPPMPIMQLLLDNGLLTWFNIDRVLVPNRPSVFLGMTDEIDQASNPNEF